ncbi:protein TILLER ANGLE CONTROL 1 [Arachis duranensis]|uniref:Protein TILLER ANGLE CONTROL 1 n=1 Tax=Arachis duranensis TaxID=130453 RepID=A0A6P4DH39_ARADU|nr:protein TILLER ANGLE CONTROL 1 [Arachis duranensis]
MKIFNWVHKRFHHSTTLKDGFASNMKNIEPTRSNNEDSEGMMKQVALAELFGGWKDGILTIGTLGCDPLMNSYSQNKQYYALESEEDQEEEEEQEDEENYNGEDDNEVNPLMQSTFEEVKKVDETDENSIEEMEKKKKGERITLADLFLADSDVKMEGAKSKDEKQSSIMKGKHHNHAHMHALSFTKKLIPRGLNKDNLHPIQDIKKLMKKMLKRKIHPELLDVKNPKTSDTNDTASLLLI